MKGAAVVIERDEFKALTNRVVCNEQSLNDFKEKQIVINTTFSITLKVLVALAAASLTGIVALIVHML